MKDQSTEAAYGLARQRYSALGVDTEAGLSRLTSVELSLPCWQGDDVQGFEIHEAAVSDSSMRTTGNYPGRARTPDELRQDLLKALSPIPGRHRVNLHAMYGEFSDSRVDRNQIKPEHFTGWMDWAKQNSLKLDFNATLFNHPKAASGFTLSSRDDATRAFWIDHVKRCRTISAQIGKAQGSPCYHNLWIPDGMKDTCVDRGGYRKLLLESLDRIFSETFPVHEVRDSLEPKLFGIGSESYVVGSFEFYLGYALSHGLALCLDTGHFHPTESVADKLSALLPFSKELVLHISRGVRWDSDHVPVFDDALRELCCEIVRTDALDRVHIALDFFDASINRVGAWVIGARAVLKGLLSALLEPRERLLTAEHSGDYLSRLALLEETRSLPLGAVWDHYCLQNGIPLDSEWVAEVKAYEREVLSQR